MNPKVTSEITRLFHILDEITEFFSDYQNTYNYILELINNRKQYIDCIESLETILEEILKQEKERTELLLNKNEKCDKVAFVEINILDWAKKFKSEIGTCFDENEQKTLMSIAKKKCIDETELRIIRRIKLDISNYLKNIRQLEI